MAPRSTCTRKTRRATRCSRSSARSSKKRYDVVLRFVPLGHVEGVTPALLKESWEGAERADLVSTLIAIKQALPNAAIEQTGDHAAMSYGNGALALLRENGVWKIEDFN